MCPMVPISLMMAMLFAIIEYASASSIVLDSKSIQLHDGQSTNVSFYLNETTPVDALLCSVSSSAESTAIVDKCHLETNKSSGLVHGRFGVTGDLLGYSDVSIKVKSGSQTFEEKLHVKVILHKTVVQQIFLGSIILLVSLNYVNMGCAIDMHVIKETLKKPVAPIVGMVTQFGVMPLLSYLTAIYYLNEPYLQLGLFTFGCSPGGGASNMWTVLLGGNLDLSVTMTFVSTVASLGFMPLWLFTVGRTFFKDSAPQIPFQNIISGLAGMIIPLGVGLVMQRYCPKGTAFCRRILAPFSILMIIFIVIFGTYANLYMLRLITWEIAFAAALNVWVGFLIGMIIARVSGLSWRDSIAVMVETGVQNTGVAIVLLGVSLPKPDGDLATIVPVAASTVTPIPLTILWLILKYTRSPRKSDRVAIAERDVKFEPIEP